MKRALLLVLLLGGCATAEPRVVVREVLVPVAQPCVADVGEAPQYTDTPEAIRAAVDVFERVKLVLLGREERDARLRILEGQAKVCRAAK